MAASDQIRDQKPLHHRHTDGPAQGKPERDLTGELERQQDALNH
jgi:hypothetical protein